MTELNNNKSPTPKIATSKFRIIVYASDLRGEYYIRIQKNKIKMHFYPEYERQTGRIKRHKDAKIYNYAEKSVFAK